MPKKLPGERYRYIAFGIEGGSFSRSDFLSALLRTSRGTSLKDNFRITVFEGDFGILKMPHTLKEDAVQVLNSMVEIGGTPCTVTTLRTSGTIKTLKEMYRHRIRPESRFE